MALAYLNGGGGGGGIRHKTIKTEDYKNLSYADKHNPYVIWILDDMKASDLGGVDISDIKVHACVWRTYQNLSVDDQNDPRVMWLIIDKNAKDLQALGFGANETQGSKLYNVAAELDQAEMVKTINALIDRVNDMSIALNQISTMLNADQ